MRLLTSAAIGALAVTLSFAQAPAGKAEFEVASVKRTRPDTPAQAGNSCKGGPGTSDPGLFTCSRAPLSYLITEAYNLQFYELAAPEWTLYAGTDGYDVNARVPPSTTREQFREMLQVLLAQRFLLSVHWDQKKYPEYALRVGKTEPKMKPTVSAETVDPKFAIKMVDGHLRLEFVKERLSAFADMLTAYVTAPVLDETALTPAYDFTLDFMPDDRWRGFPYLPKPADASAPSALPLEAAIKEQLGLILEKRDGSLRVLVVDKAEKSPTGN
jgi:uncharacterized protein (TIGR03435 family)